MFAKTDIEQYFIAEKKGALLFLVSGIASLLIALFLYFAGDVFCRGIAFPVFFVGLLFAIAGFAVYRRSDGDRVRNVYAYDMNPSELGSREWPRMKQVMKNFLVLRYAEILLFCTGAGLFIYFSGTGTDESWRGFGLGLSIMSFIALIGDHYAALRGKRYFEGLSSFLKKEK